MNLKRQRINGVPNNRQVTLHHNVQKVLSYLEKEWSHRVAAEFLMEIDRRIELLTKQPFVGAPSPK